MIPQWLANQILGKIEYGTDEYWRKERKSKFRRNARQEEERTLQTAECIIGLWATHKPVEMPLYTMMSTEQAKKRFNI